MNTFTIKKKSGTYAELLETYGFSNLLRKFFDVLNIPDVEIVITDKDSIFEVTTSVDITDEMLRKLPYFPIFKYIKQKVDSEVSQYSDYYDYPTQRDRKKERNNQLSTIRDTKNISPEEKRRQINNVEENYVIDVEFDVYSQISSPNNFPGFTKLYNNLYLNQSLFSNFIKEILSCYSDESYNSKSFEKIIKDKRLEFFKTITATQLYNPSQGQGLNKPKADGLNRKNFDSSWISETMKISGALSDMICQLVKFGSSYDLKVFVPEYKQVNYTFKSHLIPDFKKYLKGNTPIKIDVLNILLLTEKILEHSVFAGRRRKVKDIVTGLHSVYQKDLGQNKAVVNIGFIHVPNFIDVGSREENQDWIDILKEQRLIIGSLDEDKGATSGLKLYRNFISASDINSFFGFSFWYAAYMSAKLSNKKYAKSFTIKSLNKFYNIMDNSNLKLKEIIENKGFQAVAKAIRKSTVTLQYTPKDARKYEVRYGVAQTLQTKSKSSEDLAEYIGEFVSIYNAETARFAEKTGKSLRANVREDELTEFYQLLDKYSSRLVGALLASYGFALAAKNQTNQDDDVETEMLEETNEE